MRLTPGELKVMRLLWEHGEMKPPEIAELYQPPIKNAALRAVLAVLMDKKHVKRRREGRAYFYSAITAQQRACQSMLGELLETFFDGSAKKLMLNLAEDEALSDDDLREIKRLTSAGKSGAKKSSRKSTNPRRGKK